MRCCTTSVAHGNGPTCSCSDLQITTLIATKFSLDSGSTRNIERRSHGIFRFCVFWLVIKIKTHLINITGIPLRSESIRRRIAGSQWGVDHG